MASFAGVAAVVLVRRKNLGLHLPWIVAALAVFLAATAWFAFETWRLGRMPGGSTLPGMTMGIAAGLLIFFEFALWMRKKLRVWRTFGSALQWMVAHIWLGLLVVPLSFYHSGFHFHGTLATALLLLMLAVVLSGVFGLVLQQFLPTQMLRDVPGETVYSQIDRIVGFIRRDAQRVVEQVCGPLAGAQALTEEEEELEELEQQFVVVGAVRSTGAVQGKVVQTRASLAQVAEADAIRDFHLNVLDAFLTPGRLPLRSPLALRSRGEALFRDLRAKVDPAAHEAIDALEGMATQRRDLALQARLHGWLHSWLLIHLPLSMALVVLLVVHIWVAMLYW